ncbi:recombinase family protein [Patescibacteria group bacterium]|nr:recombinase family protein [Patescibacteria group bacterium]MBU1075131.1 recombinase family protein [Patescibacteria group bacterium]MBU1951767.1 recombinase family protein [Patescibacteria group bacterium]
MNNTKLKEEIGTRQDQLSPKMKYCLYARKSTESEERQILSLDSQIKEMLQLAEREGLDVVDMRRESHSAKTTGQRPVFNELLNDIRNEKFNGILTWAPDRLSRNAGDLGAVIDLMDQKALLEIRTYGQVFTNSPNEKFLLMILGSQAKLENDNRGVNVKRGLRTRVEMGLWPGMAPLGYLNQNRQDKKCQIIIDATRAPVIKQIFEKVAYEKMSGRKIYNWLRYELNFYTRGNKSLTLGGIFRILDNHFYYGTFEYPRNSDNWYQGKHKPIITQELFDKAQVQLKRNQIVRENKEFAFTKLFTCGKCGSGISAEEKYKKLKDGTSAKYIYYGCTRSRDRNCKNKYIREEELITELARIFDNINLNELGMKQKLEQEMKRFSHFQHVVTGTKSKDVLDESEINIRKYAKYLLKEGSITEKRELLANLRSRLIYQDKTITLMK